MELVVVHVAGHSTCSEQASVAKSMVAKPLNSAWQVSVVQQASGPVVGGVARSVVQQALVSVARVVANSWLLGASLAVACLQGELRRGYCCLAQPGERWWIGQGCMGC